MSYPCTTRRTTALLLAVAAALALGTYDAHAAAPRCKADGATCSKNSGCCSGTCVKTPIGKRRFSGVCGTVGNPNGEACSTNTECASGHCADGVCCNMACTGSCSTCDGGTCAPKAAGEPCDDGLFCTATDTCNGSGTCQGTGATCPLWSQSEVCTVCDEASDSCSQNEGLTCGLANGQACSAWFQCETGSCVDGVCCDTACSGTCEACTANKTGGTDGTCAPIAGYTDPDAECEDGLCQTGLCNGFGSCGIIEWGTDPRDECPDGPCVTGKCDGGGGCGVLQSDTPCNDGVGCSQTDRCDGAGTCVGTGNGCGHTEGTNYQCQCFESSDTCSFEGVSCVP